MFHWADTKGLPLLDLKDLRAVISYLTADEGELDEIGGVSKATAGEAVVTVMSERGAPTPVAWTSSSCGQRRARSRAACSAPGGAADSPVYNSIF